ncbi:MAG: hypothetical protein VX077_04100, partial [Pseudomonadota bacterium]|nr:hypothetical protein [Pseudomonadota bacterium]
QAYALNDRDGDSLSTLLRDAQHRALLIDAARGENSAALGVPADGTLVSGADASDPAGDRVSSAVTDAAVDEIGEVGEVVDDAMVEVSADPAALEEIESAEVALVSTLSTASSTLAPVGTPVGAPVGVPAAVPGNAEDETSAGITFSLSRNGSFRLGSKQPGAEPEEPTESFSLEAIVTLLQNR